VQGWQLAKTFLCSLPIQDLAEEHEQNTFSLVLTVEEKEQKRIMWAGYLFWQILSTTTLLAVPLTSSTSREPKFLRSFFEERANSRQGTDIAEDIDVLVGALKDCALDLYSCLLLPLVRDPKDPYLLAALGTTIFSGNLIAQTALRKSQPVVVVDDPGRSEYLPILLDDPVDKESESGGDISDEVSILISSAGQAQARGELTFSGDTSTRPTDISAVGQESASDSLADNGLKQRRRTFGGKEKSQSGGEEQNKKGGGGGRRRSGDGRQKAGRGRNKKSARKTKTGEEEAKRKLKKGKKQSTRKSYAAESRKGLASGKLKKQGNHLNSTDALVSSVAKSILRRATGGSLKKPEDWNENKVDRDQFRDLNDVTDEPDRMLEDFPGCGSTQPNSANQQPWLGALYAVSLDPGNETERFVVPVALLSAKTKLHPNWPTIIVATGDIFDTETMSRSFGSVSSEDLAAWGMRLEVRFASEIPSDPVVLPVTSITWHPGFAGEGREEQNMSELAAIEVDSANLWHSHQPVHPVCLPRSTDQYTTVSQVGWHIEPSRLGEKLLEGSTTDNLGPPIALPTELEECEHVAALGSVGGEDASANTNLCFSSGESRSPGWGSLILSSDDSLNRVSLVGFSRRKMPRLPRGGVETGSSIFCLLNWLAKIYGRTWPHSHLCDQNLPV